MNNTDKEEKNENGDVIFVWALSFVGSAFVWFAVVKGIGYSILIGFLYFLGFMVCLLMFFYCMGFPLYPGQKPIDLDE